MKPYYEADGTTLYHGDCLELAEVWTGQDVLVTDPPYGVRHRSSRMSNAHHPVEQRVTGDESIMVRDAALALWGGRPAAVFGLWRQPRPPETLHRLIWHKAGSKPGMRTMPWYPADEEIYILGTGWQGKPTQGVLVTGAPLDGAYGLIAQTGHPTPKPVPLMQKLIERTPPGASIADPFAGSGSTLLAARNLGRQAVGVELEERYCEIIARRLDQGVLNFEEAAA